MAVAVLGMRGAGNFAKADERPKNYREMILLLFPNGDAPLTAITSMGRSEKTDDPEFRWMEKGLPVQRGIIVGAHLTEGNTPAIGDDTIATADDYASIRPKPDGGADQDTSWLKVGHLLLHEPSGEVMRVTNVVDGVKIIVQRDIGDKFPGATNPALTGDATTGDAITIIGSGFQEGAPIGSAIAYAPLSHYNYTQIFRTPLFLTRTARKTRLRWDATGPWREARREALQIHAIEMEKALIWGERQETTAVAPTGGAGAPFDAGIGTGTPIRTTRGIVNWLPAITSSGVSVHMDIATQYSGVLTEKVFDDWCEEVFRYGSSEKLLLCGGTFLNVINQLAKNKLTITSVPTDETYGMALQRVISPFGTFLLKQHPLLSHNPSWRKDAICIDVDKVRIRPLDDTRFLLNRQSPGDDATKDEYLTELGLELQFSGAQSDTGIGGGMVAGTAPAAHGRLKGVSVYGG